MGVKVTAAYVTVRVPNLAGQEVLGEFFQDAVLPEKANREDVERLLRKGMAVEVDETPAEPETEDKPEKPAKATPAKKPASGN